VDHYANKNITITKSTLNYPRRHTRVESEVNSIKPLKQKEFTCDLFATMDIETLTINGLQVPVLISLVKINTYSLLKISITLN
jgi:hypothetical protein